MTNMAALSCAAEHYSILLHMKTLENYRSVSSLLVLKATGRENRKKPVAISIERMVLTAVITGSAAGGNEGVEVKQYASHDPRAINHLSLM